MNIYTLFNIGKINFKTNFLIVHNEIWEILAKVEDENIQKKLIDEVYKREDEKNKMLLYVIEKIKNENS
jgi:hypothetical protein